jgi:SAM-dependent methyltransferase
VGFEAQWLADRGPYDEAALDPVAVGLILGWAAALPDDHFPVVVDLGSGTGAALRRVRRWLAPRPIHAYAVDRDAALLDRWTRRLCSSGVVSIVGDLLGPLEPLGGPPDGTVDLVVGHALADLLPLDHLAAQAAALVRPGGLVHLALAYDGLTVFAPAIDAGLEADVLAAFHQHMDRPRAEVASYGGSTAGRRLGPALKAAGLEVLRDAPSAWTARADGAIGRRLLDRMIRFVVDAVAEVGGLPGADLARWEDQQRSPLAAGTLTVQVGHRDLLARKPIPDISS